MESGQSAMDPTKEPAFEDSGWGYVKAPGSPQQVVNHSNTSREILQWSGSKGGLTKATISAHATAVADLCPETVRMVFNGLYN